MSQESLPNGLPKLHRYITDHSTSGQAVFSTQLPEEQPWNNIENTAHFALGYTTSEFPVNLNKNRDISNYESFLNKAPGLVVRGGTTLRIVDVPPGSLSPMHRTVSLDYGVVLEGEVWLELDSGEKRLMRRGDTAIQRGTNHAWRNQSNTEWARMLYVLQECEPIEIEGKRLVEDYGGMSKEVRASS
jgi:quercetin dioxygenase-like cupin family protein